MPKHVHLYEAVMVALLLAVGWFGVAEADGRSPETDLAAPGAALYEKAVTESVITLKSKKEQAALDAQGRPPSPGPDYYWCKNCKTYHKKKPAPAPGQKPAAAHRPGAAHPSPHAHAATAARPLSPGPGHFWCENCKTYHKKQTPAAAQQPGASQAAPQQPGGDYYYCEKCKTYHHRKPVAKQPASDVSHILGGLTNNPSWSPLIAPAGAKR